jgi:hypothetical protein
LSTKSFPTISANKSQRYAADEEVSLNPCFRDKILTIVACVAILTKKIKVMKRAFPFARGIRLRSYTTKRLTFWDRLGRNEIGEEVIESRMSVCDARKISEPVRSCRMLMRDYIHNSLYHPVYGYFSQAAAVFSPPSPFVFNDLRDADHFMASLGALYQQEERNVKNRQIWHTPTELFQPYYGEAIARHILKTYRNLHTREPLVIYEVGAGNGTLARNILDYLRKEEPNIYRNAKYNIIEISTQLGKKQAKNLAGHKISITNKSILDWDQKIDQACFVIGLEVLVFVY